MNELRKEIDGTELLNAIKNSIGDARYTVQKLSELFLETVQPLKLEENEDAFIKLEQVIHDLQYFLEFITELKTGVRYFNGFGLPADPISSQDSSLNLFQEMHSAFEAKDLIMLSDLIEYELSPLLLKENEWLGALDEKLAAYEAC